MDFETIIKKALEEQIKSLEGEPFKSTSEAMEGLKAFLGAKPSFKEGDNVGLNDAGKRRYNFPKNGQVAIITKLFDAPVMNDSEFVDMQICVAIAKDNYKFYTVDSRYYRAATGATNVFKFNQPTK